MPSISHGFELKREAKIPEVNSTARLYRHVKTGAELLSLVNTDENKVFGATFRTPPADSTGVAHILEHSVLCGTEKYRAKDPFAELAKSSLNTFLNAMTYPDKTTYPTASTNLKDFYNLVDVYLDCVFYPLLTRETFLRQGWHHEIEARQGEMSYKGVVFNEMKGGYASPDAVLSDWSQRSLYPDTTYGFDSGGDPKEILDLSHEKLVAFYKRYYHPSNARLYFYGDDDPDERLRRLDAVLAAFEPQPVKSTVALQSRFASPKRVTKTFAAGEGDEKGRQARVTVNWMLDEVGNAENDLALRILDHILIGTPAAPLRKALLESGLGEDLAASGLDQDLRQARFSVGLKGMDVADADKLEALVLDTCKGLVANGIDKATIDAAVNTAEFYLREQNTGGFPRGLALMLGAMRPWLHDGDPFAALAFEKPLDAIKAKVETGERLFEGLIERHLVANPHRSLVLLRPDPAQAERENAEERARIERERKAMSSTEIDSLIETTAELKRRAEAPDRPEDLAAIPSLKLADVERAAPAVPSVVGKLEGVSLLSHELATNGIVYLDLVLDLGVLPAELLPWVKIVATALTETGAGKRDFVTLTQDIGRLTGGIDTEVLVLNENGTGGVQCRLALRGKATPERLVDLVELMRDILLEPHFAERERIRQIVLERKAALEARVVPAGSLVARIRLTSAITAAGFAEEQMGGASAIAFTREVAQRFDRDWTEIKATLERVRTMLVDRASLVANVTADAAGLKRVEPHLAKLLAALPSAGTKRQVWTPRSAPMGEGLTIPAKVNYVVKGASLAQLGFKSGGATHVIKSHLDMNWLWHRVRVQGGAYGGGSIFDRRSGVFAYYSYRDPNLAATLDVFDATPEFLRDEAVSESDLERCIIGTIGDIEPYRLPDAKGFAAMQRHLVGDTPEVLQRVRDEVLSTTPAQVRAFADAAAAIAKTGRVVVVGSSGGIEAANAERPGLLQVTPLL